jgi:hypothetical protein
MRLRIPEALTSERAERYEISIRLRPDGFSFAGIIPGESSSFFFTDTRLDRTKSYAVGLKDIFYEHEFFTYPFKRTTVICANCRYTLVPESVFTEAHKERIMTFVFPHLIQESVVLHEPLSPLDAEVLYSFPKDIYEFCSRSLDEPVFTHSVTLSLLNWRKQNLSSFPKQLYIDVRGAVLDAACFDKGSLTFLNSFDIEDTVDVAYYIVCIWKQTGMNQLSDHLLISADHPIYEELSTTLRSYIRNIRSLRRHVWLNPDGSSTEIPPDIASLTS